MALDANGQLDQETLNQFKEKIQEDITKLGINAVVIDVVLSIFTMEAFNRNMNCTINTAIDLLIDKEIVGKEEFRSALADNLRETSKKLDEMLEALNELELKKSNGSLEN